MGIGEERVSKESGNRGERVSSQSGNREREGIQPEWERSNCREGIGGERVSS